MISASSFIHKWGRARPDAPAIALGAHCLWTYRSFSQRVAGLAGGLRKGGIQAGDHLGLVMKNHPDYLTCLAACWHLGAVAVPINAKLHPDEVGYILDHANIHTVFVNAGAQSNLPNDLTCPIIDIDSPDFDRLCRTDPVSAVPVLPDDLAWLFYTSGTTGQPKGAMLSHRNLMMMSYCYAVDIDPHPPWSALLHPAPLSHGSGLYALPFMMKGGCQVIPESGQFDPDEIFALTDHWRNCSFFAAPTMIRRLTHATRDHAMPRLKTIIYGGAPMLQQDILDYLERFGPKLAQLYGQGESPMTITGMPRDIYAQTDHPDWHARLSSAGLPLSGVEVTVVTPEGQSVPAGETGEIITRSDCVMQGYWQAPEATAAALRDGWLWTGDMGYLDTSGYLTLTDRSKDLIISGGSNIYPREVEEVLLKHPDVSEVAVIGGKDPDWGEVVVACIVTSGRDISSSELDRLCQAHIARYKRPKRYEFLDALPKNNYGKIVKRHLRERFS